MIDHDREIISTQLQPVESDKDDYYKYEVPENNDFSLNKGAYVGYILIYNPKTKTHISSNTVKAMVLSGSDQELSSAINENILDEFFDHINMMKIQMEDYLTKIKKITELNIQINNDIQKKVGDINE